MDYQKITRYLDNITDQQSKFRTNNWVLVNDDASGTSNVGSEIKFKITMLKSHFCDYSDICMLVMQRVDDLAITAEESNKQVVFKNCAPFESRINEISNTRVVNVADLDVVILM